MIINDPRLWRYHGQWEFAANLVMIEFPIPRGQLIPFCWSRQVWESRSFIFTRSVPVSASKMMIMLLDNGDTLHPEMLTPPQNTYRVFSRMCFMVKVSLSNTYAPLSTRLCLAVIWHMTLFFIGKEGQEDQENETKLHTGYYQLTAFY